MSDGLKLPIYLDNSATTPLDPRVVDRMLPYLRESFGNPASTTHEFGRVASRAVETARAEVAALIGADEREIAWTSGATESNNLAIKGAAATLAKRGRHLVTVETEHKAVLDTMKELERQGCEITYLAPEPNGLVDLGRFEAALRPDTILASVMLVNNEIGVIQDVAAIGAICRRHDVLFHVDAAQATGKVEIDLTRLPVDLMSLTAHKSYGPKGIGALYVRKRNPRVKLKPLIDGGGHEGGLRSGTLNVPAIVGFGEACEIARAEMMDEAKRLRELRDRLWKGLRTLDQVTLNGHPDRRLPGNLHVSFKHVEVESLMAELDGIALSSGAACTTAKAEPSHVLKALGIPEDLARGSLRFGLGRFTTEAEIDAVVKRVVDAVKKLRKLSPLYKEKR